MHNNQMYFKFPKKIHPFKTSAMVKRLAQMQKFQLEASDVTTSGDIAYSPVTEQIIIIYTLFSQTEQ